MDKLIQKYAENLVKGLIAVVMGLVVFIFMDKTTGQEARYMAMIKDNKELCIQISKQLEDIKINTVRTRAGMRVISKYLESEYPAIYTDIEWAEMYDINTYFSGPRGGKRETKPEQ